MFRESDRVSGSSQNIRDCIYKYDDSYYSLHGSITLYTLFLAYYWCGPMIPYSERIVKGGSEILHYYKACLAISVGKVVFYYYRSKISAVTINSLLRHVND